jgi:hypothetical protein
MFEIPTTFGPIPDATLNTAFVSGGTTMAARLEPSLLTRLLEGLEVHGRIASELCLILIASLGIARAIAAWAAYTSLGHGLGL